MALSKKRPTAIDLFSGCGGTTVGLKKAGFTVLGAVEVAPLAIEAYRLNHKEVHVWDKDIVKLSGQEILRKFGIKQGALGLLAGCPPCQGFSSMRTRNGARRNCDKRNSLVLEMLRLAKTLKPKAVMMENVPQIINGRHFKEFVAGLKKLGYVVNYEIKDAANYGVPQKRKRLLLLAGLNTQIPFGDESETITTVRDALGKLPKAGLSGDHLHDISEDRGQRIKNLIADIPKDGGSRGDLPKSRQLDCHKRCDGFKDVYGRMSWDKPSPTITGGCFNPSKGRFLHPTENRAITLREAALLQTFPPRYKFPKTKSKAAIALLIGNALPPLFISQNAIKIRKALGF
jgi:DNA (cytosine-5)-methyltransferase 1